MLSAIASDVANRGKTSYFVNKDKKSVQLTLFFCSYLLMLFCFTQILPRKQQHIAREASSRILLCCLLRLLGECTAIRPEQILILTTLTNYFPFFHKSLCRLNNFSLCIVPDQTPELSYMEAYGYERFPNPPSGWKSDIASQSAALLSSPEI